MTKVYLTEQQICCNMNVVSEVQRQNEQNFKKVPSFTTKWRSLGLTDEDLTFKERKMLKKLVEVLKEE